MPGQTRVTCSVTHNVMNSIAPSPLLLYCHLNMNARLFAKTRTIIKISRFNQVENKETSGECTRVSTRIKYTADLTFHSTLNGPIKTREAHI